MNDQTPISDAAILAWIEGEASGQSRAAIERALERDPALARRARAMHYQRHALARLGEIDAAAAPADLAARAISTADGLAAAEPDLAALAAFDDSTLGELPRSKVGSLREPAPWSIAGLRQSFQSLPEWTRPLAAAATLTIAAGGLIYAGWSAFEPSATTRDSNETKQIAGGQSSDNHPSLRGGQSADAGLPDTGVTDPAGESSVSSRAWPVFAAAGADGAAESPRSLSAARAADAARRGTLGVVLTASDRTDTRTAIAALEGVVAHGSAPSGLALEIPLHAVPLGGAIDADADSLAICLARLAAAAGSPQSVALEIGSTLKVGSDQHPAAGQSPSRLPGAEAEWFATPDDVFWWAGGAEAFAVRVTARVPITIVTTAPPEQ